MNPRFTVLTSRGRAEGSFVFPETRDSKLAGSFGTPCVFDVRLAAQLGLANRHNR